MFSTLKSALRRTSPADIQNVLTSAQPFISDGPTAEAADRLTNHLTSLTEAATKALTDALAEGEADPRTLEPLAAQYAEFSVVPEVATLLSELRKTMSALQQTMRNKLRAALAEAQLAPMREMLDEARVFGSAVLVEVSAVQRKFDALSKAIMSEIKTLLNTEDVDAIKARLLPTPPPFSASLFVLRALSTPQVDSGSLYRLR